jgi:hypothetical protein
MTALLRMDGRHVSTLCNAVASHPTCFQLSSPQSTPVWPDRGEFSPFGRLFLVEKFIGVMAKDKSYPFEEKSLDLSLTKYVLLHFVRLFQNVSGPPGPPTPSEWFHDFLPQVKKQLAHTGLPCSVSRGTRASSLAKRVRLASSFTKPLPKVIHFLRRKTSRAKKGLTGRRRRSTSRKPSFPRAANLAVLPVGKLHSGVQTKTLFPPVFFSAKGGFPKPGLPDGLFSNQKSRRG